MVLIVLSIIFLIALLAGLSKYGHDIWSNALQHKPYNKKKKMDEADNKRYKTIFLLFGLAMSLMLCFLTFNLLFNHIIPNNSDKSIIDKIEAELEEIPVIDLPPPPPPTEVIIQPQVEEAEEELEEEPKITMDTVSEEPIEIIIADMNTEEGPEEEVIDNTIYGFGTISKNASFPGGSSEMRKFLGQNLKYPLYELQNEIGGTVYVTFVVEKNGTVSSVKVVRAVTSESLNKEALRLINSMPRWSPGETTDGIIVRQRLNIPIKFKVSD